MVSRLSRYARYAIADGIPRRSLILAMIVGSIVNLINQGDALIGGLPINLIKVALTYSVPYCVSTYAAVSYRLAVEEHRRPNPWGE